MSRGNLFAYVVLFMWPIFSIWLYKTKTIQVASIWTILGGFMVLPAGTFVDFPLIPPLGKNSIPALAAIIGCWQVKRRKITYFSNKGFINILVVFMFVGPLLTVLLNGDRVIVGGRILPGLNFHDAISTTIPKILYITPFFIGRQFFRTYEDQLLTFKILVVAGLVYSLPMLLEIRISPQLHTWVYGYFPHSFLQQARDGGFRPVVFMGHGLWVAFFTACVLLASAVLWKRREKIRKFSPSMVSYYLLILLVLCKSMASLVYGVFALVVIKSMTYKMQLRIAVVLAILALSYPTMSILKLFPHQKVAEVATSTMGAERSESLVYRFNNEHILLDHARKRFFFGWGGWGRNRVYDDETGNDISVTDGRWIITFGVSGFLGFIAEFGLLGITIFRARIASKLIKSSQELALLAAHALLIGIIMIDQLPNASLAPWLWLLAGILLGRSEDIMSKKKAPINK